MSCQCNIELPDHLRRAADDLYGRAGLQAAVDHMTELSRLVEAGERNLAAQERATALRVTTGPATYEAQFALARRHAERARTSLRRTVEGEAWAEIRRGVDTRGREFAESVDALRKTWAVALNHTADLPAVDALELLGIFDRAAETARNQGVDGLVGLFDEQLAEFDLILVPDRDYGREPHSPLEWWKWLIIIGVLLIALVALIACLWWSGCSWIYAVFVGVCASVLATGGWLIGPCVNVLF